MQYAELFSSTFLSSISDHADRVSERQAPDFPAMMTVHRPLVENL
jgi:hypothetical protein